MCERQGGRAEGVEGGSSRACCRVTADEAWAINEICCHFVAPLFNNEIKSLRSQLIPLLGPLACTTPPFHVPLSLSALTALSDQRLAQLSTRLLTFDKWPGPWLAPPTSWPGPSAAVAPCSSALFGFDLVCRQCNEQHFVRLVQIFEMCCGSLRQLSSNRSTCPARVHAAYA